MKVTVMSSLFMLASGASAITGILYDVRIPTLLPKTTLLERQQIKKIADLAVNLQIWNSFAPNDLNCIPVGQKFNIEIDGMALGKFTSTSKQKAFLYSTNVCTFIGPGSSMPSQGIVIMQDGQPVAHYVFLGGASALYSVNDINQNGFSELVLENWWNEGGLSNNLDVAELRPTRQLLIKDLTTYLCLETLTTKVIRVTYGKTPKFTVQAITGTCNNNKAADRLQSVGSVKPLAVQTGPLDWKTAPIK